MLAIFHKNGDRDPKQISSLFAGRKKGSFSLPVGKREKTVFKMSGICRDYVKRMSDPFAITQIHVCWFSIRREKCNKSVYRNHIVGRSEWKNSCWNFNTYPSPSVFAVLSGNRILLRLLISHVLQLLLRASKCKTTWWD